MANISHIQVVNIVKMYLHDKFTIILNMIFDLVIDLKSHTNVSIVK